MNDLTTVQAITLSIAILGAVLGIINTWHNLNKTKVKLKVEPGHAIPYGLVDPNVKYYISITNLSAFPLTIAQVGMKYRGTEKKGIILDSLLPRRLEPRSSVTIYFEDMPQLLGHRIKCAYAKTACGVTKTGNSPALKQIVAKHNLS